MTTTRISLANVRPASNPEESLSIVLQAIGEAAAGGASIVCFPECYVPGYRTQAPQSIPDQAWLDRTWARVDEQASDAGIAVILGTERVVAGRLVISARVTNADGQLLGFQDKVQLDPSEEPIYAPGEGRQVFHCGQLTFGIVICHEGWRYPELTRWAVVQGATIVFHPHFELVENPQLRPARFADPDNTFHEKAALCRSAENTCFFATVNCALRGSTTTSAVVDPDGVLLTHQPYGAEGLLFADIDVERATGHLAKRFRPESVRDIGG